MVLISDQFKMGMMTMPMKDQRKASIYKFLLDEGHIPKNFIGLTQGCL